MQIRLFDNGFHPRRAERIARAEQRVCLLPALFESNEALVKALDGGLAARVCGS